MTTVSADPTPEVPAAFGGTWEAFVRDWWQTSTLPDAPANMAAALNALCRLWPQEVDRLVERAFRGPLMIAPALELGSMFLACEGLPSFHEVLARLTGGERSAYSELVLVSALMKLSLAPSFAPLIDGHVLDAACNLEGMLLHFEVVAPNRSDAHTARMQTVGRLSDAVQASIKSCRVEIEVLDGYGDPDLTAVVEAIPLAPPGEWVILADKARVRRIDVGQRLLPLFDNPQGMQVVIAGEREVQGNSASAVIRHEDSDARAKRIFNEEYHQFSAAVPNVLVVNVSGLSDGMKDWPAHMSRLLQPNRNRRVGAVAFFDQYVIGPKIRRRWRLLANPHAHIRIPEALLAGLESLDESAFYGIQRHERVSAAV